MVEGRTEHFSLEHVFTHPTVSPTRDFRCFTLQLHTHTHTTLSAIVTLVIVGKFKILAKTSGYHRRE